MGSALDLGSRVREFEPRISDHLESERKVRAGLSHFNGVKTGGKRKLAAKQVGLKRESVEPSVLETRNSNV